MIEVRDHACGIQRRSLKSPEGKGNAAERSPKWRHGDSRHGLAACVLAILNYLGLRAEVKYGFQPWEALQTVTLSAAKALGSRSLEPGKLADIVFGRRTSARHPGCGNIQRVMVDGVLLARVRKLGLLWVQEAANGRTADF